MSILAWYTMKNVKDHTGNNNHLDITGMPTVVDEQGYMQFTWGTYCRSSINPYVGKNIANVSMCGWFTVKSFCTESIYNSLFNIEYSAAASTDERALGVCIYNKKLALDIYNLGGVLDTGFSLETNRKYFCSVVKDGTSINVYIDGILIYTKIATGDFSFITNAETKVSVGINLAGSTEYCNCVFEDLMFFNHSLTESEVDYYYKKSYQIKNKQLLLHLPLDSFTPLAGNIVDNGSPTISNETAVLNKSCKFTQTKYLKTDIDLDVLDNYTVSFWYNQSTSLTSGQHLFILDDQFGTGGAGNILVFSTSTNFNVRVQHNLKLHNYVYDKLPIGKWVFITIKVSCDQVELYIDFNKKSFVSVNRTGNGTYANTLCINSTGSDYYTPVYAYYINDLRLYNGLLDEADIREIFMCKVAHYTFDSISTDGIIMDKSIFRNNSEPISASYVPSVLELNSGNKVINTHNSKDSYICCPQSLKPRNNFSFNFWFYNYGNLNKILNGKFVSCTEASGFNFGNGAGGAEVMALLMMKSDGSSYVSTNTALNNYRDGWNMVTCIRDGDKGYIYCNCKKIGEISGIGTGPFKYIDTNNLILLSESNGGKNIATGHTPTCLFDEFTMFANSLNESDILELYDNTKCKFFNRDNERATLLAHFPLNGSVNDITGQYKVTNPSSEHPLFTSVNSKLNKSAFLNSTINDKINTNLSIEDISNYSVSFWINVKSKPASWTHVMGSGIDSFLNGFFICIEALSDQYLTYRCNVDGKSVSYSIPDNGYINKWCHVVIFRNKDYVYVNGTKIQCIFKSNSETIVSNAAPYISINTFSAKHSSNVLLNDLRFYNGEILENEINSLYKCNVIDYDFNDEIDKDGVIRDRTEYCNNSYPVTNPAKQIKFGNSRGLVSDEFGNTYLHLNDSSMLSTITLNIWVNIDKEFWPQTDGRSIIDCTDASGYWIGVYPDSLKVGVHDGVSYKVVTINRTSISNGWNNISFTCGNMVLKVFINGIVVGQIALGSEYIFYTITKNILLTNNEFTQKYGLNGIVGELQIYASALAEYEIKELFISKKARYEYNNLGLNLLAHFPFDRDTTDITNQCNLLNRIQEHPPLQELANSKLNKSLSLSNTNRIRTDLSMKRYNRFTISFWLYWSDSIIDRLNFISSGDIAYDYVNGPTVYTRKAEKGLGFRNNVGTATYVSITNNIFPSNKWYNIVWVYDNNTVYIYVDKVLVLTEIMPSDTGHTDKAAFPGIVIGGNNTGAYLNDLRFYSGCATQNDVIDIYNTEILHYDCNDYIFDNQSVIDKSLFKNHSIPIQSGKAPYIMDGGAVNDRYWSFNGTTHGIELPVTCKVKNAISMSCWFKLNSLGKRQDILECFDGLGTGMFVDIDNKVAFCSINSPEFIILKSTSTVAAGIWYNLICTFDGNTTNIYINGILDSTNATIIGNIPYNSQNFIIGNYKFSNRYLDGCLDDIRMYASAIDLATVKSIYNEKITRHVEPYIEQNELICHFPLNGDIYDYTGNSEILSQSVIEYSHDSNIGRSLVCDGATKYGLSFRNNLIQQCINNKKFSVSIRVKLSNVDTTIYHLFGYGSGAANSLFHIVLYSGKLQLSYYGGNYDIEAEPQPNIWYLITITVNGDVHTVYLNGVKVKDIIITTVPTLGNTGFIGNYSNTSHKLNGMLNDIRVYNYTLDESEVRDLYLCKIGKYSFAHPVRPTINFVNKFISEETDSFKMDYNPIENTYKVTAKKDMSTITYGYYCTIGTYKTLVNQSIIISFTLVSYKLSDSFIPIGCSGFGLLTNELPECNKRYSRTIKHTTEWNHSLSLFYSPSTQTSNIKAGDYWIIKDPQIEVNEYSSPYTENTDPYVVEYVIDSSGYNNHLTAPMSRFPYYVNDSVTGDGCYKFDSTILSNLQAINYLPITDKYSVSLWCKVNKVIGTTNPIISLATPAPHYYLLVIRASDMSTVSILCASKAHTTTLTIPFDVSKWFHIVATLDINNNLDVYINCEKVASIPISGTITNYNLQLCLGDLRDNRGLCFNGLIDDVNIYSNIIDDVEIRRLYRTRAEITSTEEFVFSAINQKQNLIQYINDDLWENNGKDSISSSSNYVYGTWFSANGWTDNRSRAIIRDGGCLLSKVIGTNGTNWGALRLFPKEGMFKTNRKYLFLYDASGFTTVSSLFILSNSTGWPDKSQGINYKLPIKLNGLQTAMSTGQHNTYNTYGGILDLTGYDIYDTGTDGLIYRCDAELGIVVSHGNCVAPGSEVFLSNFRLYDITEEYDRYNGMLDVTMMGLYKPSIDSKGILSAHEFNETGKPIRYIRNWLNGNTLNGGSHWVEIAAYANGTNIALKKPVSSNNGTISQSLLDTITDGNTLIHFNGMGTKKEYVQVDLGGIVDIDYITMWHYYGDVRKYHDNILEVSIDGINWEVLFDSNIDGEYNETADGKTIYCRPGCVSMSPSTIFANNFIEG